MNLWVEKYRPQTLEGYVGNEVIKNKVLDYLNQGSIQNLLLHGVAGTGKTTLAKLIAKSVGKKLKYKMVDFHSSRPGHDLRYALDGNLMKKLGWKPKVSIEERIDQVVNWTLKNKRWLKIWNIRKKDPFLDCETLKYNNKLELKEIGNQIKSIKDVMGQFMGLIFIPKNELSKFKNLINKNIDKNIQTTELINISIKNNIKIKVLENRSFWYEFDDYKDVKNFKKF